MKSLYATISKAALSKVPQRPKTPNFSTDQGPGSSPPKRPPRKPRSQSSMSDHHKSMSSLNTMSKAQSRTTLDGRTWDVHSHSSSTLPRSHGSSRPTPTRPIPQPRPSTAPTRGSKTRSSMERSNPSNSHMVHGFRGQQNDNRDPPKFEKR